MAVAADVAADVAVAVAVAMAVTVAVAGSSPAPSLRTGFHLGPCPRLYCCHRPCTGVAGAVGKVIPGRRGVGNCDHFGGDGCDWGGDATAGR